MQVGLLNVEGYYNYLLTFIDKAVDDGFISPSQRHIIVSAPTATELVQKLEVIYTFCTLASYHFNLGPEFNLTRMCFYGTNRSVLSECLLNSHLISFHNFPLLISHSLGRS